MSNTKRCADLVRQCLAAGISEFCVCSGSRNAPLIGVLARTENIKIYSFFDERAAAFFALGRCKDSQKPVGVLCTSGTAVAEMLPACIEAHYTRSPLLLISADRPPQYRKTGAPQSIEQKDIFAAYVSSSWDLTASQAAPDLSAALCEGPVHVNICIDEPLFENKLADTYRFSIGSKKAEAPKSPDMGAFLSFLHQEGPLLVLLGSLRPEDQVAVKNFCKKIGAPIWAEALSGLRENRELSQQILKSGERFLSKVPWRRVLRIGGVPSCRYWRDLEKNQDILLCSITNEGFSGVARNSLVIREAPGTFLEKAHDFPTVRAEEKLYHLDQLFRQQLQLLLGEYPSSEPALISFLSQRIADNSTVFLGNSLVIREWNLAARYSVEKRSYFANRGANGIDGSLSTFLGASTQKRGLSWGIFGDLSTLYDLNAPWILDQLPGGKNHAFVVVNNKGGKLFSRVKDLNSLDDRSRQIVELPHRIDFEHWAKMWKLDHLLVKQQEDFKIPTHSFVMEIQPDPEQSAEFWLRYEKLWEAL